MKILIAAIAVAFAVPAAAQSADPHAQHSAGQHAQHGQQADHSKHAPKPDGHGKDECCCKGMAEGRKMDCCKEHGEHGSAKPKS